MPKLKSLLIAAAAAVLSTSAAFADTKADDRSYLPRQDLRAQSKQADVLAAPETKPRLLNGPDGTRRRHYAQWRGHRDNASRRFFAGFPGIFFSPFR